MRKFKLLAITFMMFAGISILSQDAAMACGWAGQGTTYYRDQPTRIPCNAWGSNRYVGSGTYNYFDAYYGSIIGVSTCDSPFDTQITIFDRNPAWTQRAYVDDNGPWCSGTRASVTFTAGNVSTRDHLAVVNRYNCQMHDFTGTSARLKIREVNPATPGTPSIQSYNCGNTVLQRTTTPPGGITYYWQSSSSGSSTGLGSGSTKTVTSSGTWYLRARSGRGCWSSVSGGRYAAVTTVQGTAQTYGNGYWYVSCYNGNNFNSYYGYYTDNGYSHYSQNRWSTGGTPSSANNSDGNAYSGCTIPSDNHSTISSRQNFACGRYRIDIPNHDDQAYLFINGSQVWSHTGCCDAHTGVWTGELSTSSQVQIRQREGGGGSHIGINVVDITATLSGGTTTHQNTVTVCTGYNSGTLTAGTTASGGSHGYSYQWQLSTNNGSWTNISGATGTSYDPPALNSAGNYRYRRRVTDGCGRVAYNSGVRTVNVVADPTITMNSSNSTVCSGGNSTLSVTGSGGTGSFYFQWQSSPNNSSWTTVNSNNGTGNPNTYNTGALTSSTYFRGRFVRNGSYCDDPYSPSRLVTVVSDPSIAISTPSQTICSGGNVGLTASTAGGTGSCSFQWQRVAGTSGGSWANVGSNSVTYNTGSLTGTYRYRVRRICNGSGCDDPYSNTVTITVTADPSVSITTPSETVCSGASITLNASASGGTGTQSYQWQRRAGTSGTFVNFGANSASQSTGTLTGTYQFRVQRSATGSGCGTATSNTVTMTVVADPSISINQANQSICYGTGLTLTASASGGTGSQSYQWQRAPGASGGSFSNVGSNSSSYSTGNLTTTYRYRVLRSATGTGCGTATSSVRIITVPSQLSVGTSTVSSTCGNANGSATALPSGGSTPYSYAWQGGGTSATKGSVSAGSYSVTVTDGLGCTATGTANVTDVGSPTASITGQTNLQCFGDANGAATVTISGGTIPFNIAWSNGSNNNGVGTGSYSVTGLTAGGITATVTDGNGCVVSANTSITQPSQLVATLGSKTDVLCFGQSTGAADINVSGGTGGKTYAWSNGGGSSQDLTAVNAGTYVLTVTDANTCTATVSVTIDQPAAALSASSTTVDVDCNGNSNGSIDLTVSGGTSGYSYAWSNGPVSQDLSGLDGGTYTVTITDAAGCTLTHSKTIAENAALVFGSTVKTDVACFGNSTGTITVAGAGGDGNYTYNIDGGTYGASGSFTGLAAGSYAINVRDGNSCVTGQTVAIDQPLAALSITISSITDIECNGDAAGAIDVTINGGTSPYTYSWSGPSGTYTTEDISNVLAGTYNLTVTDFQNCTATASPSISELNVLSATAAVTDVSACFGSANGAVTFTPSGGSGTYQFSIDAGVTYQSSASFTGLTAGTYDAYIKDDGILGTCEVQLPNVVISQPTDYAAPVLPGGSSYTSCGLLVVNVTPPGGGADDARLYTAVPVPGGHVETNTAFVFGALTAGTYTYYVTSYDAVNDCESSTYSTFTIEVINPVLISGSVTGVSCYGDGNGAIDITPTGGNGSYTYQWSNGATTQDLTGLSGGSYNVIVTDGNGCFNIAKYEVVEYAPLTANVTIPLANGYSIKCAGDSSGQAIVNVSGGDGNYSYLWSDGSTDGSRNDFPAGSYTLTITDGNTCMVTKSATYSDPPVVSLNLETSYQCSGGGYTSASLGLIPSGGQAPFVYRINGGNFQSGNIFSGIADGSSDTVYVRDANGCQDSLIVATVLPTGNSPVGDCGFVYVAPGIEGGDANNPGTPDCPTTLGAAMSYVTSTRNHVRVLGGASEYTYSSPVVIVDDVIIEGNFERDANGNWIKNSSLSTTINFENSYTSPAAGVGYYVGLISTNRSGWIAKDLVVKVQTSGASGTQDGNGRSVYGVLVNSGSANYELNNVQIEVGDASDGSDGTPGTNGINGTNGPDGSIGDFIETTSSTPVTLFGGDGGNGPAGAGTSGGGGETSKANPNVTSCVLGAGDAISSGAGGAGSFGQRIHLNNPDTYFAGGFGGDGGFVSSPCNFTAAGASRVNPTPGGGYVWDFYNDPQPALVDIAANGTDGANGTAGTGFTPGSTPGTSSITEFYSPGAGATGNPGTGAGGGSGGSGQGSVFIDGTNGTPYFKAFVFGSGGGAGGAGGAGGYGGAGGGGGGSTFGVFISSTATTGAALNHVFVNSLGTAGNGGDGGVGGSGGTGGFGGAGGPAGVDTVRSIIVSNPAGNGGNGGNGGAGGRGQDGDDGTSSSIYFGGGSAPAQTAAPVNGTVGVIAVKGCTNSEVIITKTSGDSWNIHGGAFENDITSSTSSFDINSDTAIIYYTAVGSNDLSLGATTYSSFINISTTRAQPNITSAPISAVCIGGSVDLTTNAAGIDYRWVVADINTPQTPLFASSSQNVYGITVPIAGTFQAKLQVRDQCCGWSVPTYTTFTVNPVPDAIPSISGPSTLCAGASGVVFTAPVSALAAPNGSSTTGYQWTVPAGASIVSPGGSAGVVSGGNVSITVDLFTNAGDVTITPSNACGDGPTTTKAITIAPSPVVTAISGVSTACDGATEIYSAVVSGGTAAATYLWSTGATTTSISVTPTANFTIGVTVTEGSCSHSLSKSVTVDPVPSAANPITGDQSVSYLQTGATYTTTAAAGATSYLWTVPAGATITSGQGTLSITVDWGATSGNVVVTPTYNSCGGTAATLAVTVGTAPLVWNGNVSTDWSTATNWTPNQVPTVNDNALIPASRPNYPSTYTGTTVAKTLTIQSGGSVNIPAGITLAISGDVSVNAGATLGFLTTAGAAGNITLTGDWEMDGSFNPGTPSAGGGEVSFNGTAQQSLTGISSTFFHLDVSNSAGVSVDVSTFVSGHLRLGNGTLTTNGNVTLKSDANNTGLVDDFSPGHVGAISGTITMQRYVPTGSTGFHHVGSPVNTPNVTQLGELNLYGPNNGQVIPRAVCDPDAIDPFSPYGNLFEWRETASFLFSCTQSGWFVRSSGTLTNGRGYAAIFGSATNPVVIDMSGNATTGAVTYGGLDNTTAVGNGHHLVANPYPSPIEWTAPTGFASAAQLWQSSGTYQGSYQPRLSGIGEVIPAMQGFFVDVIGTGSKSFTLTNADRTTADVAYLRQGKQWDWDYRVLVDLVTSTGNNDVTSIYFSNSPDFDITDGFDITGLDARKNKVPGANNLYTNIVNHPDPVSWNTMPLQSDVKSVPMGLEVSQNGTFTFNTTIEDFAPSALIILEDKLLGTLQNLRENASYTFTQTTSDDPDRFVIHFVPAADVVKTDASCDGNDGTIAVDLGVFNVGNTTIEWDSYSIVENTTSAVVSSGTNANGAINVSQLGDGEYTLTLNYGGYQSVETVELFSATPVAASYIAPANIAYAQSLVQFFNQSTGATSFDWNFGDGNTSILEDPTHIYTQPGTYNVVLTATNGECTDTYTQSFKVDADPSLGIADPNASIVNILGYENRVTVLLSNINEPYLVMNIYDVVGRKVIATKRIDSKTTKHVVELNDIAAGYYFVVVEGEEQGVTDKKVFLTNK